MVNRRELLKFGSAATVGLIAAPRLGLATTNSRVLPLVDTHHDDYLAAEYFVDGWYNPDVMAQVDWLMRDWRTDETRRIDPGLLDILYTLQSELGRGEPVHIISGYRTAATNAMLRSRSRNVARNSYHMRGQAADMRIPGVGLRTLRNLAMDLQAGGVGYYPRSDFVHVDTGPIRDW